MDVNIMSATPTHSPRPSSALTSPSSASVGSAAHKLRHVLSFDTLCDKSQDAAMATGPIIDPQKRLALPKKPNLLQDAIGEFFGTFVMILLGEGISAQVLLSHNTKGDWQSIIWGWGISVMLGAYTAGSSGGHLNPAVTLANCVYRKFPWSKFPAYLAAQVLGGTFGAAVVYANYLRAIDAFEGGPGVRTVGLPTSTAAVFCTYPAPFMTRIGMFFSEFIASSALMFSLFAVADVPHPLMPLMVCFIIVVIGAGLGWETSYALNMARDFGPRLLTYLMGYGSGVWSAGGYYFWIPVVSPFFGCLFGGFLYDFFLYTGDSPVNSFHLDFGWLTHPDFGWLIHPCLHRTTGPSYHFHLRHDASDKV